MGSSLLTAHCLLPTEMEQIIAMLLAGGQGSRLNILASERAKPAVPFGGIYRIIDFTLTNIAYSGVENVGVLTQYRPSSLMDHLGQGKAWDLIGRRRGVKILPPFTGTTSADWYKGTADAVFQNLQYLRDHNPDLVLILSGDHIYRMDYTEMIAFHKTRKADLTLAVMKASLEEATRFGTVFVDADGRITGFEEKPPKPRSTLISLGIYLFKTDVLYKTLTEGAKQNFYDFGKDIIPNMLGTYRLYAYPFEGYWRDVGTIQSYLDANMDVLDSSSGLDLASWKVRTNLEDRSIGDRPPVKFLGDGNAVNSILSRGCLISGSVKNSILSPGVIVHKGAKVQNSIIMHDCVLGEEAFLDKVILDKDVKVGAKSILGYGEENRPNEQFPTHLNTGITVVGKGATLPAGIRIGRNCIIYPKVTPSHFTTQVVKGGSTIFFEESQETRA